jgi:membrane protease YdiL (CAAX protease family)
LPVFFLLVLLFSIPFWAVDPLVQQLLPEGLPVNLPISSLMAVAPMAAAAVLVQREKGSAAARELLKRAFDYKRIRRPAWYAPILLLWPALMVVQYGWMKVMRAPLADPQIPFLAVLVSFVVFFIGALGEEVGWQGYAFEPLQARWNALAASIILGMVWAVWHVIPLIQVGQAPLWIAWQCLSMVAARIITVWLYNNTGQSVFAAILFHAMNNVTTVLLPEYGWPYNPAVAVITLAVAVAVITFLWGPETLARYRYARPRRDAQPSVAN